MEREGRGERGRTREGKVRGREENRKGGKKEGKDEGGGLAGERRER